MRALKHLRLALLLTAVFTYVGAVRPITAHAAAPVAAMAAAVTTESCDDVCGPTVDCDTACNGTYYEEPWDTTCGAHYGGVLDGYCAGTCGDAYCNSANGEDPDTCYDDCGYCGDGHCSGPEDIGSCPADCHVCGDGICSGGETCSSCPEDCNPTDDPCEAVGEEGTADGCGSFEIRNGAGYCCKVYSYLSQYEVQYYMDGGPNGACASVCGTHQQCIEFVGVGYYDPEDPDNPHDTSTIGWGCVGLGELWCNE